jgi:hypothetical protein
MEQPSSSPQASALYLLEHSDIGIVMLDVELRVVSMNDYAKTVLPVDEKRPFHKLVMDFHPPQAGPKLKFLLSQANVSDIHSMPMTMIINIPERVLLIRVTRLTNHENVTSGYVMTFYDITEQVGLLDAAAGPKQPRTLARIPAAKNNSIVLLPIGEVLYLRSDGHYSWARTLAGEYFCNLAIGDLEGRLDPRAFQRIHRSFIVNIDHVVQVHRDAGNVRLALRNCEMELPVGRSYVEAVLERLGLAGSALR